MSSWSGAATTTSPARVTSPNRGSAWAFSNAAAISLLNLTAGPDSAHTLAAVRSFSACDAERLPAYYQMLDASGHLLRRQLLETPPANPRRLRDQWGTLQLGRHFRELAPSVQRGIPELFTRSAGDLLDHWFGN